MNLFDCLFPCALQHSWWNIGSEHCMSQEFVNSMGVNSSVAAAGDVGNSPGNSGFTDMSAYRDTVGIMIRERKKKIAGLSTLKKKFIKRRRSSKACDHGRMIRELVSDWTPLEVTALLEEYEALAALKDLCVQAELARPPASTFKQDLSALYDYKYCTDADLVYRGACFPIHRALLSIRCPYFRDLLAGCPGYGARICLELRTQVDVQLFSALLRYLYTGDICPHDTNIDLNLLRRLREEFGTPNALETDLQYLLETGDYADAALVFTSDGLDCQRPDSGSSEYGFRPKLELPCHKAILSARSPFFRNLLQRRSRTGEEHTERALHIPTRIVLDESVIPKRYARVLLHVIYLDHVDLSLISRGGCGGGLGEAQALAHTGRVRPSPLEETMELYQIGRFLELDILSQGCEDLILEWLSLDTLPTVLQWSQQPYGSAWVHRQALHFLREEFQAIVQSPVLHQLDKVHLQEALKNPFLQASELEVLHGVLKWGEQQLVKRMEDREPNLLNHTAHSVTRKGVKKRDLSDVELREILSDLLPLVHIDHVLPANNEILNQAIRRGLVSTPPSHMLGGDENMRVNAWIRCGKNNGLFIRPRLFMPYYEELKILVEDHLVQEVELHRMRRARYMQDIPDTLYMVGHKPKHRPYGMANVDVLAATIPVPDRAVTSAMLKREQKLRQSPSCQRALNLLLSSVHEINQQIRLRVVREFNLPDPVADILESCHCENEIGPNEENVVEASPKKLNLKGHGSNYGHHMTFPRQNNFSRAPHELPAVVPEGDFRFPNEPESSSCSDGHLSDIMPDVAMASASLGQIQLHEQPEMELDLGDGGSHLHAVVETPQSLRNSLHHPVDYRNYSSSTFPHHRTESTQSYHHRTPPMPRFL
ncbi:BTB/POZ domain-containing protein 7 isoform X2 [Agrilus planipennis]|uniref:BTB/POZ domain-containing protein 7 isoform X2 n=1 Tax=Agrilus planipennis TaxID=224129 RepID=A0A1W4XRB3_AGRPL|nr:BTB/POZ domain-containing protein 7 isoform X2 [Agrilus planipennis]